MAKTSICSINAKLQSQKPEASHDVMTRRNSRRLLLFKHHHPRLFRLMAPKTSTVASHPLSLLVSLTCSCLSPACTHAFLLPEFQDTTRSMHRFNLHASRHRHRRTRIAARSMHVCIPSCPQQHAWYFHRWHMAQHVSWPAHPQVCCASLDVTCQPCVHITTSL
jgi:hypothetical protein